MKLSKIGSSSRLCGLLTLKLSSRLLEFLPYDTLTTYPGIIYQNHKIVHIDIDYQVLLGEDDFPNEVIDDIAVKLSELMVEDGKCLNIHNIVFRHNLINPKNILQPVVTCEVKYTNGVYENIDEVISKRESDDRDFRYTFYSGVI